jgi:hypothetical protein
MKEEKEEGAIGFGGLKASMVVGEEVQWVLILDLETCLPMKMMMKMSMERMVKMKQRTTP